MARNLLKPDSIAAPAALARVRRRQLASILVQRADILPPADRDLILEVFGERRTVREVVRRQDPDPATLDRRARVARRVLQRLIARVLSPSFDAVRTRSHAWPPAMARVGHACFVEGLSRREAARRLAMSLYNIRRYADAIRAAALQPSTTRDAA